MHWFETVNIVGLGTYNEGVVERSVDVGDTEDELVGSNTLGTIEGKFLLLGVGVLGVLSVLSLSLSVSLKCDKQPRGQQNTEIRNTISIAAE